MVRVAYLQYAPEFGKRKENIERLIPLALSKEYRLLVLPELFGTGYNFASPEEVADVAEEPSDGPTFKALSAIAKKRKAHVVGGFPEDAGGVIYNSAMLVGPDGLVGVHRKTHLFHNEKKLFTPGDEGYRVYDLGGFSVGLLICYDWMFPEVARVLSLRGADVLCHPSALVMPWGQRAMVTRSLENGVFSITANRCGTEEREHETFTFTGHSQIVGPQGEMLVSSHAEEEVVCTAEIDPSVARRKVFGPDNRFFEDRRTDLFDPLLR
jgi:predicted amidohydrolase